MLLDFFQLKITNAINHLYGECSGIKIIVSPVVSGINGDLTTNVAFALAKIMGKKPSDIALELIAELNKDAEFSDYACDIEEKNGHVNWSLSQMAYSDALYKLYNTEDVGKNDALVRQFITLEFVSANPTGPISIVNGRAAVLGNVLSNIFDKSGAFVATHYYVNNNAESSQIIALQNTFDYYDKIKNGEEVEFPAEGYKGDLIKNSWENYDKIKSQCPTGISAFFQHGVEVILQKQLQDLHEIGVEYSRVVRENDIVNAFCLKDVFQSFGKNLDDFTYVLNNAVWLKTTDYGDDKDRVIIREDGRSTYFHNDILYHAFKLRETCSYRKLINIWGADHHGYIARINAVMRMWDKPDVEIILTQMVNLEVEEDGKPVVFIGSKREGQYLRLKEDFVDQVGVDSARWYFLNGDPATHVTINVKKAAEQNMGNPVFYIQYAHARFCRILQKSAESNVFAGKKFINISLNDSPEAKSLILKLDMYNKIVQTAALEFNVQVLKTYLYQLAQVMQAYYEKERLIGADKSKWLAGLCLVQTSVNVLKDGLELLGISAPKNMDKRGDM